MGFTRRQFNTMTVSGLAAPFALLGQSKPKVVVIGGGAGGATAARAIAVQSKGAIDVTLVDASQFYTSCFYSNLYLGGFRSFTSITHSFEKLTSDYGIAVLNKYATEIDRSNKRVSFEDGSTLAYDRIIVAPGIDIQYQSIPGYSKEASEIAPHAWQAGPQTELLHDQLQALEDGQNIVMVAPPNPYRCPPGPYERVSMMAHLIKTRGYKNSRISILDVKPGFSKQALFTEGWLRHYGDIIEWLPPDIHGGVISVDAEAGKVETDLDVFEGAVLNIIPAMKAGLIASRSGLTDDSGFCPVEGSSMRSKLDSSVFVIGDASIAGAMPKSAFSANSQAKVAALQVVRELLGSEAFPVRYANTCWSLISPDNSVKVGAQYVVNDTDEIVVESNFISAPGESTELRKATYQESVGWYNGITADMFG